MSRLLKLSCTLTCVLSKRFLLRLHEVQTIEKLAVHHGSCGLLQQDGKIKSNLRLLRKHSVKYNSNTKKYMKYHSLTPKKKFQ
jgi:hypothetical protein